MKSTLAILFLLAACAGSPQQSTDAALTSTERDPACATCPPDCCQGESAANATPDAKGGCCDENGGSCCAPSPKAHAAPTQPKQ